jgi:tetratricopeptide (TPR) repeat protein
LFRIDCDEYKMSFWDRFRDAVKGARSRMKPPTPAIVRLRDRYRDAVKGARSRMEPPTPALVHLDIEYPERLSRLLIFVKWLLAIPLYIVLLLLGIGACIVTFIAFWAILFTGRYPERPFDVIKMVMAFQFKLYSYFPLLLTDRWWPGEEHPLKYKVDRPESLSRLVLVLKLVSFLLNVVLAIIEVGICVLFIVAIPVWWVILITGKYPRKLFDFNVRLLQWLARVMAWQLLMHDNWRLFGTTRPVQVAVTAGIVGFLALGIISVASQPATWQVGPMMWGSTWEVMWETEGLSEAEQHFEAGSELQGQGRVREAIEEYNEAIELDPEMVVAYNNRGRAYIEQGMYESAIEDLDEAIRLDPEFVMPYNNRGLAYIGLGEFERAIEDYDEAIRIDPDYASAYNNRGAAYFRLVEFERAIEDFTEAIRINSDIASAYVWRAMAYTILFMDAEAEQDIERAIELGVDRTELEAVIQELRDRRLP